MKREAVRAHHLRFGSIPTWCLGLTLLACSASPATAEDGITKTSELGPVKVTVTLTPLQPVIGDTVTLALEVVAEKDVELLMPEFGEALDRYRILDFVPRQAIDEKGRTVATQTYRLQPPSSGPHAIPPILLEFVDRRAGRRAAPDGLDAYELLTERIDFEVGSVLPSDAKADLKPPLGKLAPLAPPPPSRWPWMVLALVLVLGSSPFVVRAYLAWRRRARLRSAYDIARARLERLLASRRPDREQIDAFYVELSSIVRRYLEDRFDLRAPELTTEEFLEGVQYTPDLSGDHPSLLREFLRQADLVKFAGFKPSGEDIERSVSAARRFLEETRENAPLLDEPEGQQDPVPQIADRAGSKESSGV
ncbi:MAG: hypothetical protein ACC645_00015 [Pirellulales bacterium]